MSELASQRRGEDAGLGLWRQAEGPRAPERTDYIANETSDLFCATRLYVASVFALHSRLRGLLHLDQLEMIPASPESMQLATNSNFLILC